MAGIYKQITTRPSLDHLFVQELLVDRSYTKFCLGFYFPYLENTPQFIKDGFIEHRFLDSITWQELEDSREKLRPDLRHQIKTSTITKFKSDPTVYGIGPWLNPFVLVDTKISIFDTVENAINAYQPFISDENVKQLLSQTDNTIEFSFYDDDVLIDTISLK